MNLSQKISRIALLMIGTATLLTSGCGYFRRAQCLYQPPPPVAPLGTLSDPCWKMQEANAAASDFVVYQHEFEMNKVRLNTDGEDHVKQIAARLAEGQDVPVIIERSMTTARPNTEFKYPVHPNPELDMKRREVVVHSLAAMGIADAEQRVVVAPALAEGMIATEARDAYLQGFRRGYGGYGYGYGTTGYGAFGGGFFGPFSTSARIGR